MAFKGLFQLKAFYDFMALKFKVSPQNLWPAPQTVVFSLVNLPSHLKCCALPQKYPKVLRAKHACESFVSNLNEHLRLSILWQCPLSSPTTEKISFPQSSLVFCLQLDVFSRLSVIWVQTPTSEEGYASEYSEIISVACRSSIHLDQSL